MRKILVYSSLEWNAEHWDKKITWDDLDLPIYRGEKVDETGREYRSIEDKHTMFALISKISPARMTIGPGEGNREPRTLEMNSGGAVLVGNGFIYFDTKLGDITN